MSSVNMEQTAGDLPVPRAPSNGIRMAMVLLFVVSTLNYMDRYIITILIEPIRQEFGLSDKEAGLITGLSFALLYAGMAMPMAMLADRVDRAKLLGWIVGLWSVATMLCGIAGNFTQLFIARLGVGANEAGSLPTMHSLISEYFPTGRRALALSTLTVGGAIGSSLSYLIGGYLAHLYGWRAAFLMAGLPGVLVSLLIFALMRDPGRSVAHARAAVPPAMTAIRKLWSRRSYGAIVLGMALSSLSQNAAQAWKPAFYQRVFGMSLSEVGIWLSGSQLLTGFLGVLIGGWAADHFYGRDRRAGLWVMIVSVAAAPTFGVATFLTSDAHLSLIYLQFFVIFGGLWPGPYAALQQALAGPRYRAMSSAIAVMAATFIGFALGPLFVGTVSDYLTPSLGKDALRYGLALSMAFSLWGIVHLLLAARTLVGDMEKAERDA